MTEKEMYTCLITGKTFSVINKDINIGIRQGLTKAMEIIQDAKMSGFDPYGTNRNPVLDAVENKIASLIFSKDYRE